MTVIWSHEKCQLITFNILIMLTLTCITFISIFIHHPNIFNMMRFTNGCQQRLLRHVHALDDVNLLACCFNFQTQTAHHVCFLGWLWLQRSAQSEPALGKIDPKVASFAPSKWYLHLRRNVGYKTIQRPLRSITEPSLVSLLIPTKIGTFSASMVYMPR